MARWIWLAVAAQFLGGAASAQALHEVVSKDLVWRLKPTGEDMARAYPQKAQIAEQAGWVILECQTAANGEVKNCQILGEAPANFGFGAAGLKLASKFRIDVRKTDPEVLKGGVVTIPILMLTPTGAPLPPRDYLAGQSAALLTVAPKGAGGIACATPSVPSQKCLMHPFAWTKSPSLREGAALVRAATEGPAVTALLCTIRADLKLEGCKPLGAPNASQEAAMTGLVDLFLSPDKADDLTPMAGNPVLVRFNWAALKQAVATSVLTNPIP